MESLTRQLTTILSIGSLFFVGISCTASTPSSQPTHISPSQDLQAATSLFLDEENWIKHDGRGNASTSHPVDIDLNSLEAGEICVINTTEAEAKKLDEFAYTQGYTKEKGHTLKVLGFVMSILYVGEGGSVQQGINALRQEFPSQIIDANHHYYLQGSTTQIDPYRYGQDLVGWNEQALSCTTQDIHIGMIDTSVNASHSLLQRQTIHTQSFISETTRKAPQNHGTAVATLLVGHAAAANSGLLPKATLSVAEAFKKTQFDQIEATTWSIVRALDWLVKEHVDVINLSIGGPDNALLAYAVNQALSHKIPIIAAAGNTGPHGSSMYPAAQEGVMAVTALDAALHPYSHASRGSYIAFSAPGVDIWIPQGTYKGAFKSGTSFATPFVTTAAAAIKQSHPEWTPDQVARHLAKNALDLGTDGKDDTFGWGLIQIPQTCPEQPRSIRTQS